LSGIFILKEMSRNIESIFPDVFSYPESRHEIQLSSFYEQPRTQAKPNAKSTQFTHLFGNPQPTPHLKSIIVDATNTGGTQSNGSSAAIGPSNGSSNINAGNNHVILPPSRRVVKCLISYTSTTLLVVTFMIINAVSCMAVPESTSPILGTLWGGFLNFWALVTIVQMISHSVYLCTQTEIFCSLAHLFVVLSSTALIPTALFAKFLWLAPCLCIVIAAHQSQLLCLVYSHVRNQWIYALGGSTVVIISMIQLVQIDPTKEDMKLASFVWSLISIYTLYGFAIANSNGAVLVDVTIGASPTWQLQE